MASAGLRALFARVAARPRTPAGARAASEEAGFRTLLARMAARFRSAAAARESGDAAAGSVPATALRRSKIKNKGSSMSEELSKSKDVSAKLKAQSSSLKVHSSPQNKQGPPKANLQVMKEMATAHPQKPTMLEQFVSNAEHKVGLALRFSNVLKDAGIAFRNTMQTAGAVVLGSSMFLYHKDKLRENYVKLKDLFPSSANSSVAPAPASSSPPAVPAPTSSSPTAVPATASSNPRAA